MNTILNTLNSLIEKPVTVKLLRSKTSSLTFYASGRLSKNDISSSIVIWIVAPKAVMPDGLSYCSFYTSRVLRIIPKSFMKNAIIVLSEDDST